MPELYAEILLPRKMHGSSDVLTYALPAEKTEDFQEGQLVEIPLRNGKIRGVIWNIHDRKPAFRTKPIDRIVGNSIHLNSRQIALAKHIAAYYICPLHKVIKLFFPATAFTRKKSLEEIPPLEKDNFREADLQLTSEQISALEKIKKSTKSTILLHGVTGSGKTEIYRRLTLDAMKAGQQVLMLVPEISLTPQTVKNFEKQFGKNIAVIHSKLSAKKKSNYLYNIYRSNIQIIIGSRSAIFAPFQNLGLIIIDEEHEDSYKQDQAPRYHTREIAEKICALADETQNENQRAGTNAPENSLKPRIKLILGSATPSIESYYKAKSGEYELVEMPSRIPQLDHPDALPRIHLIDLRDELKKKNYSIFSELLQVKIAANLARKQQTILFLNRRGAASAVICRDCGHVEACPDCETSLTYHSRISVENSILPSQRLICHHCGKIQPIPKTCRNCQSSLIKYIGLGTQKIEEEVTKLFPTARVLRADKDTTKKHGDFEDIYNAFHNHEADILIGTQMIGKGLHLPQVTLVGIVLADTTLTIPDFRSGEKTFQLLTQVAGRSGREKPGEVIIQTYLPDHYAVQSTLRHDYIGFYQNELINREENHYPPFNKLIKLTIEDTDAQKAYFHSHQLFRELEQTKSELHSTGTNLVDQINVFPALLPKLRGKYRWQILLGGSNPQQFLKNFSYLKPLKSDIKIDVDPLHTI